ncbi:MAG: GAF domain-containing sensor histidine kinase [Nitrospinales bacterium]
MTNETKEKDPLNLKEVEREIRRRTEEYKVLHQIAKILHNPDGLENILVSALNTLVRFQELEVENKAGIFLADHEQKTLNLFCTVGEFGQEFMEKEKSIPYGACLCGRAAVSGELLISNSCYSDSRHEHKFDNMTAHGHYIVPLKSKGELIGIMFLYTDENPPWYVRSQEILQSIGGLIADAIVSNQREEEIKNKNIQLKELNELKNKFLGIASHDLRNPIYLIKTFSEVMKDGSVGELNDKQKELTEKIYNSSNFMQGLLENLLDISKIESGNIEINKELQDFNATAKQQVELCQLLADGKNIHLYFDPGDLPNIPYDTSAITQVIGNFIGNAVKFSPPDSKVHVTTEKIENYIRFSVHDEGPGLSKEDQQLLFREFQTLSARPTGGEKSTGLGLAICKKLIHLHEGQVGVSSELGKGSVFYFSLPLE